MIFETVLAKVTTSGLTKGAIRAACTVGKQALEKTASEALSAALHPAVQARLSQLSIIQQIFFALQLTDQEAAALETFLLSPTFESWVQSVGMAQIKLHAPAEHIQQALEPLLKQALPSKSYADLSPLAQEICNLAASSAMQAWDLAGTQALLTGDDIVSSSVQNLVKDYVDNAQNQVKQAIDAGALSFSEITNFAERYKRSVALATSKLKPQSLNEAASVPLRDLYVEPQITAVHEKNQEVSERDVILAASSRSVLIGNPGGGKSTLAGKLCNDLCTDQLDRSCSDIPELAALIILRDYAQERKRQPCSIVEYLQIHSRTAYQLDPPVDAFKLLFASGRTLVAFDGLDELTEAHDRVSVRDAVEQFSLQYPICPILVTSREVGYEQAPLDRSRFRHYKLAPFDEDQVTQYAKKWFAYSCFPNHDEAERLTDSFIRESRVVPDIRSNPLMLGLLCNLYRQDGFIPKNRPDIYHRCADLLFTRWDRSRGIYIKLPLEHRLKPAMSHLAYWIYSNESLQAGVTESELLISTSRYLRRWVEDDDEADSYAQEFVNFFKGRAWVFTDTGSDRDQSLYQFTHRTFLEYFTADELVRLYPGADDLHRALSSRIRTRSWDVVCQLAFQISAQRSMSDDALIRHLCEDARRAATEEKLLILSFMARTMDVLYPIPSVRRAAVRLCIESVWRSLTYLDEDRDQISLIFEIFEGVLNTSEESLRMNASELLATAEGLLRGNDGSDEERVQMLLVLEDLSMVLRAALDSPPSKERAEFWAIESEEFSMKIGDLRSRLALSDGRVASMSWWRGESRIEDIIQTFGAGSLFNTIHFPLGRYYRSPIANRLIDVCLRDSDKVQPRSGLRPSLAWIAAECAKVAPLLLEHAPWQRNAQNDPPFAMLSYLSIIGRREHLQWPVDQQQSESVLVLLACMTEYDGNSMRTDRLSGTVSDVVEFSLSRGDDKYKTRAHQIIEERAVRDGIKSSLHLWVDEEFSFTFPQNEVAGDSPA